MSRTPRALLAVAALVALAGCGAVLPAGDSPNGPDADLEPAEPRYATPLEHSDLLADHEAALRDAENFTVVRNTTSSGSAATGYEALSTARVSLDDGRVYLVERPSPVQQTYRYANGTAFRRTANENSWSRTANDTDGRTAGEWARAPLERFLPLATYTHRGVTERGGERVHVYRATDVEAVNATALTAGDSVDTEVSAVNGTVRVRESGAVSYLQFAYTLEEADGKRHVRTTVRFSDLGETDVSPPVWVESAQERFDLANGPG